MATQKEQWEQKERNRQIGKSLFSMLDRYKDYLPQSFVSKFYDVAVTIDARCRFGQASMTQQAQGQDVELPEWLKAQREWLYSTYAKLTGKA